MSLNNRGDTIVEVMIVLAVLGFALSLGYATANRALLNTRQAQESAEATKLAETQIERLRALAPTDFTTTPQTNIYDTSRGEFCIDKSPYNTPFAIYNFSDGNRSPTDSNPNPYPNNPCKDLGSVGYSQKITYDTTGPQAPVFRVLISWDNVRGDGIDTVQMSYRAYPNGQ